MSEKEILRRQEYKANRKKWLMIQSVVLVFAIVLALGSFLAYDRMNRTYYIEYTENSAIDYQVQYPETEFFETPVLGEDQAYISSLIQGILADFHYEMHMDSTNVGFDYSYCITAMMEVADKNTGNPFYTVEEQLLPCKQATSTGGNQVRIDERAKVDFRHFNEIAKRFVSVYNLKNTSSTLTVTLNVKVLSTCDQFAENNENVYSTSVHIPLNEETMSIHLTSSAPATESKVLACETLVNKQIFLVMGYVASGLALLLALGMVVFAHMTKNEDITYTAKIRRLLNSYSSYIQRMDGDFDDQGYQVLNIKTFDELLGIRDTLQAPILMTENRDQTMSRFLIPSDAGLLYVYEVKVDNYDQIYGTAAACQV